MILFQVLVDIGVTIVNDYWFCCVEVLLSLLGCHVTTQHPVTSIRVEMWWWKPIGMSLILELLNPIGRSLVTTVEESVLPGYV